MGEAIGLVAAKTTLKAFEQAVFQAWPRWERVGSPHELSDYGAFWDFCAAQRPAHEAMGFYEDGPWAVLVETTPTRMDDAANLCALNKAVGPLVCIWLETHGACAAWQYYEAGALVREVATLDGPVTQKGSARSEEAGIDLDSFYVDEAWQVWAAFGLKSPYDASALKGFAFDDQEALEALAKMAQQRNASEAAQPPSGQAPKRPWWRFW